MKTKFSKILGVGLTLALLTSLLLTAAPVSADVTEPDIMLGDEEISAESTYTITFNVNEELVWYDLQHEDNAEVSWSSAEKKFGSSSAKLALTDGVGDAAKVSIAAPADTLLSDISTISFWWECLAKDPAQPYIAPPYATFEVDTTGDGEVDTYVVNFVALELGNCIWVESVDWTERTLPTDNDYWAVISDAGTSYATPEAALTWEVMLAKPADDPDSEVDTLGDGTVLNYKVAIGQGSEESPWPVQTVYIDDITINDTTYKIPSDIIIEFPEGTILDVDDVWANGDVTVQSTAGFGEANVPTPVGDNVVTTEDDDIYTVTIGLGKLPYAIAEAATVRVKFLGNQIANPDEPGDYALWVSTSAEDEPVESETYTIEIPDVGVLPGVVELYNSSGILMATDTGDEAIQAMLDKADEGWTVKIGEGEYTDDLDTVEAEADVTIEGSGDVEDIIVVGTWTIADEGITIDGITLDGDGEDNALVLTEDAIDFTLQNCILENADEALVYVFVDNEDDPTVIDECTFNIEDETGIFAGGVTEVTDCAFTVEEDGDGVGIEINADIEVTDCTFTGGSGVGVKVTDSTSTIEGNIFDGLDNALIINLTSAADTLTITGNTIENCAEDAIVVVAASDDGEVIDEVIIVNNDINDTDEDYYALLVDDDASGNVWMLFNNIVGNTLNVEGENDDTVVDATHNWWGDAAGPDSDSISGDEVDTSEYLGGSVAAEAVSADSLDAEDDVGVKVSGVAEATIIAVAKYTDNPQEAIADAIAFYDVYVANPVEDDKVTLKFYAGDENSTLYVWSADTETWVELEDAGYSVYGGYVHVEVLADLLGGTPFAVVAGEAEVDELLAPDLTAPESGEKDVSLKPTFAWETVPDVIGYDFELADNPNFVLPIVSLTGDVGRLIVTFYQRVTPLEYSTYYYWRVKAVSADGESAWSAGVFYTVAEVIPEPEPEAPVWTCPQCGLTFDTRSALAAHAATAHPAEEPADIVIEQPDIIVPLPDVAAPITPAWIYVIIAVGGVLVIALLVLIVRTRRVA